MRVQAFEIIRTWLFYSVVQSEDRDSARWTAWESCRVLLGLFAPFSPFVTEHMYQQLYRDHEGGVSLHLTRWPVPDERWRGDRSAVDQLAVILDATRVLRSGQRLGNSARLNQHNRPNVPSGRPDHAAAAPGRVALEVCSPVNTASTTAYPPGLGEARRERGGTMAGCGRLRSKSTSGLPNSPGTPAQVRSRCSVPSSGIS